MQAYILNTISFYADNLDTITKKEFILKKEMKDMCKTTRCDSTNFGFRKATTTVSGNKLVINILCFCPECIIQGDKLSFAITNCIEYPTTAIKNVVINVNGTEFTAIRFGNVKWDTINARKCYTVVFGTEEPTATILNDLPCSKFDYPIYTTNCNTFEKAVR